MGRNTASFSVSPIAIGTHLGEMNREDSLRYQEAIMYAFNKGINMVDTALNYRGMRSERDIGFCLTKAIVEDATLRREEVVISTKAGIIPGDIDAGLVPKDYLQEVLLQREIIRPDEINSFRHHKHVLSPNYFDFAIGESLKHLNLETIDIYYVHNPEYSLMALGERDFYRQLQRVFEKLEEKVLQRHIRDYGIATWDGLIGSPNAEGYLSLEKITACARVAGGEGHHFSFIQLPFNQGRAEANYVQNQSVKGKWLTAIEAARELGLHVTVSSPLQAGAVLEKKRALSAIIQTDGILAAMVGMKRREHVKENASVILG
ncbi:aldo/keto reductase [Pradoshia sp.]